MFDLRICPQCSGSSRSDYLRFFILRFINEISIDDKIIDLGCGKGRNIYYLKELGLKNITAVDINKFKEINNSIKFIKHDLENKIPISDKFNIILCNYIFMFIKDKKHLIKEITRISDKKSFCIVELNKKKLRNGIPYNFNEIVNLFSEKWDIVNIRLKENKFIAKKRSD
ncbi:class I SAM-dependent methyltransferase [Clostridium pasteurianum]|uniref:Methylase involved in ubiquinone/menaquinone biosynthesis n=1 Tax=Clostridium pasteurianum BC1 TaxID=86416 RepID=R4KAF5_CLOPA|nr:class I SAM-dependent methyltransferase [Clostridium pasteurianum]AGK96620.1 methylase involved in ubiquinone/menaquinone biosynthesis [Clostridium pasteurianum BC1]